MAMMMPKLAINGYSMFANHIKARLETERGRKFKMMQELLDAAAPYWKQLNENERKVSLVQFLCFVMSRGA